MTKEEMFNQNINLAYKVAAKYLINYRDEYEDIKQIALMALWKAILSYNEKYTLSTYAYTVIFNEINYYLRHVRKHEKNYSMNTEVAENMALEDTLKDSRNHIEEIENNIESKQLIKMLSEELNNFRDKEKQVFTYMLQEKTQCEIAKKLNISQPQVSRIERKITNRLEKKRTSL